MFNVKTQQDVLAIFQDIAPKFSGNLAFNALNIQPIPNGFAIVLIENIAPYGVQLDNGNFANGILKGFFSERSRDAGLLYIRGQGGYQNNLSSVKEDLARQAKDNPLRQKLFVENIARSDF